MVNHIGGSDLEQEQLELFAEWNPSPIIEMDIEGNILYLNLAARAQFPTLTTLGTKHSVLQGLMDKILGLLKAHNKFAIFAREIEYAGNIYDQQVFTIAGKGAIYIYMFDVTARKHAEEEYLKLNKELEQRVSQRTMQLKEKNEELRIAKEKAENLAERADEANRAKSTFLAVMSHEIRTPLNGVIGMTGLLLDTPLSQEQREFTETIRISGEVLLGVINDILDFSKIESGRMEIENVDFNIHLLIDEAVEIVTAQMHHGNTVPYINIAADVPKVVTGDSSKIRQVLNNFLSNAAKFTEKGTITINVKLIERKDHIVKILFEVIDTGIGIPAKVLEKLFQPFSQGDASTSRKFGGTGLGLAISKRLVQCMNGEIKVDSKPGKGSNFSFTIPLIEQTEVATAKPIGRQTTNKAPDIDRKNVRILLAEDNQINQQVALRILAKLGFRADAVANGLEVLEEIKKIPYDIILMDCQMPEMDGYTATREIRKLEAHQNKHTAVIAMTAHALKGDMEKCIAAGMDEYIVKPISINALEQALVRCLPGQELEISNRIAKTHEVNSVINFEQLNEIFAGNEQAVQQFLKQFMMYTSQLLTDIEQAIQLQDTDNALRLLQDLCEFSAKHDLMTTQGLYIKAKEKILKSDWNTASVLFHAIKDLFIRLQNEYKKKFLT